mgnify:CR=1 FL=1
MRILVFEPLKEPYVMDIEDDIHAMQEIVGGSIELILSIILDTFFSNDFKQQCLHIHSIVFS